MKEKAAIFDLDGTMFDNHAYHQQACILLCEKYGLKLTKQEFSERFVGKTTRDFVIELFGDLPEEEIAAYDYEKEALYRELYKNDIEPINGLVEFLQALATNGYTLGVATSAPIENLTFTLRALSIETLFDSLLCISDVERPKPDPEIYLKSMDNLKVSVSKTIIFEDSGPGVEAAQKAKATVIGVRTSMTEEQFGNVSMTIADYTEISPEILNKILS